MRLYNFSWGPYPRRVTNYLAEKGIADLDLVEVEFPHRPELWPEGFLQGLNPARSLPVLETEDGTRIGQSIAILEFLEERYPSPDMLGQTGEARAATRELIAVLDEATTFFGIWARHGSMLNADRHTIDLGAARIGAERFATKIRVTESIAVGPFLLGDNVSAADCVGMALLEFADKFYGVGLPTDCPKLAAWYELFSLRQAAAPPVYPGAMLATARGLPDQSRFHIDL